MLDVDALPDEAWRQIEEALRTGRSTRRDGSVVVYNDRDYATLLRWVASVKPRKLSVVSRVEDFLAPPNANQDD